MAPTATRSLVAALALAVFPLLLAPGCHKEKEAEAEEGAEEGGEEASPTAASSASASASAAHAAASAAPVVHAAPHAAASGSAPPGARSFLVPFVRAGQIEDPRERMRDFLRDTASDNAAFVRTHDAAHFKPFLEVQRPRATLVTCADSRVQAVAFDANPENDLFTVRNIGNQIASNEGSVEYGVQHLGTPVLLVLGHTGCGAVKAAMGDFSGEPPAIQRELATLQVAKGAAPAARTSKGKHKDDGEDAAWADAVIGNVHRQVAVALATFTEEVAAGHLTVVGAVYDLRNDLHQGSGKVSVVDVNGHADPAMVSAFVRSIEAELHTQAEAPKPVPARAAKPPTSG